MAKDVLKLYRGISAEDFNLATDEVLKNNRRVWRQILQHRLNGNFDFLADLDESINSLHKSIRLEYQYFTDSKVIAQGYARKVGGNLAEISVPLNDVLKYFDIEFQNFGARKKKFEIVFRVKGSILAKKIKAWKMKVARQKTT
jgi:hypothetical protein